MNSCISSAKGMLYKIYKTSDMICSVVWLFLLYVKGVIAQPYLQNHMS